MTLVLPANCRHHWVRDRRGFAQRPGQQPYVDDHQRRCPPGTFVYVPRGVPHTFKVVSAGPGKKLNLFSPAAMVGFFEDLAAAESDGTATPELLDTIAARHHMDVTGPVPDTYL